MLLNRSGSEINRWGQEQYKNSKRERDHAKKKRSAQVALPPNTYVLTVPNPTCSHQDRFS